MNTATSGTKRRAHCPRCGVGIEWTGNPNRPFCSLACRLIDLGVWLDERYRIPGPDTADDSAGDALPLPDDRPTRS